MGAAAATGALEIAHHIERDAIDPARKGAAPVKAGQRLPQAQADILGNVFGIMGIAAPAPGGAIDAVILILDQLGKSLGIAILGAPHQRLGEGGDRIGHGCGSQSHAVSLHRRSLCS